MRDSRYTGLRKPKASLLRATLSRIVPFHAYFDFVNDDNLIVWFKGGKLNTETIAGEQALWSTCYDGGTQRENLDTLGNITVDGVQNTIEISASDFDGLGVTCTGSDRISFSNANGSVRNTGLVPILGFVDLPISPVGPGPTIVTASTVAGKLRLVFDKKLKNGSYDQTKWRACQETAKLTFTGPGVRRASPFEKHIEFPVSTGLGGTCTSGDDTVHYDGGDLAMVEEATGYRVVAHSKTPVLGL